MNLTTLGSIGNTVRKFVVTGEKKAYKHGPTAMIVVGVGCAVAGAVVAVKEAVSVNSNGADVVTEVKQFEDRCTAIDNSSEKNQKWLRFRTKAMEALRLAKKLFKRFLWAIVLEACAAGLILGGHHIVLSRLSTAGVMVTSLTQNLNDLENRIKEKLPEDQANDILYDKKVEQTATIDPKNESVTMTTKKSQDKVTKKLDDPFCIEISQYTCPMINFIETNRRKAWEDILFTVSRINSYDIPNYGGITAYDFYRELHYNMKCLSKDSLAKAKVIGKYKHTGSEPMKSSYIDLRVTKDDLEAWFRGDSECLYIYPNWDGYVADKF